MESIRDTVGEKSGEERPMNGSPKKGAVPPTPQDWKRDLFAALRSPRTRYSVVALAALAGLRLGANWYAHRGVAVVLPTVRVTRPSLRAMDRSLSLPGDVEAIEQARLYAHISGYLKKIYVDEGDSVKAGDLLAEIEAPDIVQEYNKAKADADLKQETLKRYQELLAGKVVSQQEFDTIEAAAREAQARLDNASANLNYTHIRAPFSGSIARRYVYPGDLISEATRGGDQPPIFLLVNESRLRISTNVPQTETSKIHLGHPVDIEVDSLPGEAFHGAITRVDALLDENTKTQRVLIDIDNPDRKLRAGMFASIVLHVQHVDGALTVPREAVQGPADRPFVDVVAGGRVSARPVKIGISEQDFAQVVDGVTAADEVVLAGGQSFVDGTEVLTVDAGPAPASAGKEK
jgi:RND family efflux transporter MFP subunit